METEMKLGASENNLNFLTSWSAFSFSREVFCFELHMVLESTRGEFRNDLLLPSICYEPM